MLRLLLLLGVAYGISLGPAMDPEINPIEPVEMEYPPAEAPEEIPVYDVMEPIEEIILTIEDSQPVHEMEEPILSSSLEEAESEEVQHDETSVEDSADNRFFLTFTVTQSNTQTVTNAVSVFCTTTAVGAVACPARRRRREIPQVVDTVSSVVENADQEKRIIPNLAAVPAISVPSNVDFVANAVSAVQSVDKFFFPTVTVTVSPTVTVTSTNLARTVTLTASCIPATWPFPVVRCV